MKPEVEFRHQGTFFRIQFWGHISAADQDIINKLGVYTYVDLRFRNMSFGLMKVYTKFPLNEITKRKLESPIASDGGLISQLGEGNSMRPSSDYIGHFALAAGGQRVTSQRAFTFS